MSESVRVCVGERVRLVPRLSTVSTTINTTPPDEPWRVAVVPVAANAQLRHTHARYTQVQRETKRQTHSCRHADIQTGTQTDTQTDRHTHTHARTHARTHTHTHTHKDSTDNASRQAEMGVSCLWCC